MKHKRTTESTVEDLRKRAPIVIDEAVAAASKLAELAEATLKAGVTIRLHHDDKRRMKCIPLLVDCAREAFSFSKRRRCYDRIQ